MTADDLTGQPLGPRWDAVAVDFDADPDWEWRTAAGDSPEELYAALAAATRTSSARPSTVWSGRTRRSDGKRQDRGTRTTTSGR